MCRRWQEAGASCGCVVDRVCITLWPQVVLRNPLLQAVASWCRSAVSVGAGKRMLEVLRPDESPEVG